MQHYLQGLLHRRPKLPCERRHAVLDRAQEWLVPANRYRCWRYYCWSSYSFITVYLRIGKIAEISWSRCDDERGLCSERRRRNPNRCRAKGKLVSKQRLLWRQRWILCRQICCKCSYKVYTKMKFLRNGFTIHWWWQEEEGLWGNLVRPTQT